MGRVAVEPFEGVGVEELAPPQKRAVGNGEGGLGTDGVPTVDDAGEQLFDDGDRLRAGEQKVARRIQAGGDPAHAVVDESVKLAKKFGHNGTAGLVNAVLRNLHPVNYPEDRIKYLATFYSFPEFLVRLLLKIYQEETEEILNASNLPPVTSIRVNTLKTTPEEVLISLKKEGFKAERIENRRRNLLTESRAIYGESFKKGYFQIQGITQTMNIEILGAEKEETILDLCSFPGTKSTGIAEIMGDDGTVLSVDKKDLRPLVKNARRLGIKSIYPIIADVLDFSVSKAHRILLDVPCSGTGVMRKRRDLR